MAEEKIPLVLDAGSCYTRVGLATDLQPHSFLTLLADNATNLTGSYGGTHIGESAVTELSSANLRQPIAKGNVNNWDDFECFLHCAFTAWKTIESHPMLLAEPPMNSRINREKIAQLMFEKFRVPSLCFANHAVLSLYSSGRTTGLVLVSGDGVTSVTPIHEGFNIVGLLRKLDMTGSDVTSNLKKCLCTKGYALESIAELLTVREIKENLCYVSVKDKTIVPNAPSYTLPDGQEITLADEAHQLTEMLFAPQDLESTSFPRAVFDVIMKCDVNARRPLYQNIMLCGGNTMFPGFVERMDLELSSLVPSSIRVQAASHPSGLEAVWLGGAVLASLSTFDSMCLSKREYDEIGPQSIHRKAH